MFCNESLLIPRSFCSLISALLLAFSGSLDDRKDYVVEMISEELTRIKRIKISPQMLKVLSLIFIISFRLGVEILQLFEVLFLIQHLLQPRWVLAGAEPTSRGVADTIVEDPLLTFLRNAKNLIDPNQAIFTPIDLFEPVLVNVDAW